MRLTALLLWYLLVTCSCPVLADYPCLCSYAVDAPIYTKPDIRAPVAGHLYEFDCKAVVQQLSTVTWVAVMDKHQVAYIKKDSSVQQQMCNGDISSLDLVHVMPTTPFTPTQSPPVISTSQTQTSDRQTITTTAPSTTASPTSTTSATTLSKTTIPSATPTSYKATSTSGATNNSTTVRQALTTETPTTMNSTFVTTTTKTSVTAHVSSTTQGHKTTTTRPYLPPITPYKCPSNVVEYALTHNSQTQVYNNTCYEYVNHSNTWRHAEHNCQRKGGHLVYMTSLEDENEVMGFLHDVHDPNHEVWIGLSDINKEQRYEWSSGAPFNYSKWKPHHLSSNHHYQEDCVVLVPLLHNGYMQTYGQWDDVTCDERHPWVCRYDGPGLTNTGSGNTGGGGALSIFGRRVQ